MHDAFRVEIADGEADLEGIELDSLLREPLLDLKDLVELTATNEGHDEVKTLRRLKQVLHSDKERMIAAEEDVLLQLGVLDLFEVEQHVFADRLDGPLLARRVTLDLGEEHLTEGALSEQGLLLEILIAHVCLCAAGDHLRLARYTSGFLWPLIAIILEEHSVIGLC